MMLAWLLIGSSTAALLAVFGKWVWREIRYWRVRREIRRLTHLRVVSSGHPATDRTDLDGGRLRALWATQPRGDHVGRAARSFTRRLRASGDYVDELQVDHRMKDS